MIWSSRLKYLKVLKWNFHYSILFTERPSIEILDAECNKEALLLYDWGTLISETTVNYLKYNDSCIALKSLYYTPSFANCCNHHPTDHIKIILTSRFKYVRAYHDQWIRPFYLIYHSLLFKRKGGCNFTVLSLKQEEVPDSRKDTIKKKSLTFNRGLNQRAVQLSSQLEWRGLCPQSGNFVERAVSVRKPRTISRPGLDKDSSWQYHLPLVPCNLCVISVYVCCHGNYTVSKVTCACVHLVIG